MRAQAGACRRPLIRVALDGVAADLRRTPVPGPVDAEARGVDLAAPECGPGLPAAQELPGAEVLGMVQDGAAEDLRIDPDPAAVPVLVLGDPVV
jgi:hypothetical protein